MGILLNFASKFVLNGKFDGGALKIARTKA